MTRRKGLMGDSIHIKPLRMCGVVLYVYCKKLFGDLADVAGVAVEFDWDCEYGEN